MWLLRRQAQLPFACFYLPVLCHGMTNKQVLPDASTLNQYSQSTKLCVRKELSVYHFLLSLWYQDSRMIACSFLEYLGPWEPNIWLGLWKDKNCLWYIYICELVYWKSISCDCPQTTPQTGYSWCLPLHFFLIVCLAQYAVLLHPTSCPSPSQILRRIL